MLEHSVIKEGKAYLIKPCRACMGSGGLNSRLCTACNGEGKEPPVEYGDPSTTVWPVTLDSNTVKTPVSTGAAGGFKKFDAGKNALDLIPPHANEVLGLAMTGGAAKYGRQNCIADGVTYSRYIAAAKRHISAFECHRDIDDDTGLHALGHAAASVMILLELVLLGRGIDDRWPKKEDTQVEINRAHGTEGGE